MHSWLEPRLAPPLQLPRHHLIDTAIVVIVLGVLPFAWDAATAWKVLGLLVSLALVCRSAVLVWREAFSTRPQPGAG
jgi:hypothetical protein